MAPPLLLVKECTPNCCSHRHVNTIISQIAKLSLQEFQAYSWLCHSWSQLPDLSRRTALHVAASCGKGEILEWLLDELKVDLSVRDFESGYTALHRAIYYGQVSIAKTLIQYDSDLQVIDNEGMTPLDLAVADRPGFITYSINEPNEISTWGENMNSILGHPGTHKRSNPDVVSEFRKLGLSIKQVVLCKYHSVFLTQNGKVFTCGHGQGGRLGHGDQHTVLLPKLVQSLKKSTCLEIAAGTDHTLLRLQRGTVMSCGLNKCHQLGQGPDCESSLVPREMKKPEVLKGKTLRGVCAGRFHSVVWTSHEIYTVGLNAGQLGHQRGDKYIEQLKAVHSLRNYSAELLAVTCSDAATACLTAKGDVFVFHEYQCKRIAVRLSAIEQIVLAGGTLDHHTGVDMLMEKGGRELVLVLRSKWGQLYTWRGSNPSVKRCCWKIKQQLTVTDVVVTESCLIITTDKGQAYSGRLAKRMPDANETCKDIHKDKYRDGGDVDKQGRLLDRLLKEEVEEVTPTRLLGVHRALTVAADRKGRNFAVIQALPNGCIYQFPSVSPSLMSENIGRLMSEADENDIVHDAIVQAGDRRWPVHRYILGMRSHYFHQLCQDSTSTSSSSSSSSSSQTNGAADVGGVVVFKVEGVDPDIMEQVIQFVYTDSCDFLTPGYNTNKKDQVRNNNAKNNEMREDVFVDISDGRTTSAFEAHQKSKKSEKIKRSDKSEDHLKDPVKLLQEASQKLGVKILSKRLNQIKYTKGVITLQSPYDKSKFSFDRLKFPELYDVTIVTADSKEIQCHKCILASRLEYFYSMFATGWVESKKTTRLTLPAPGQALEILIDYLYTDDAQLLVDCSNEKLLCEVLVVSDQLLAARLKQLCEVALANIVSFKNVAEFLEFSSVYNADQLKETCQQFVSFNLSAILEARILEVLSEDTMQDLTDYYRATVPNVVYRVLTPSADILDQAYLDELVAEYQSSDPSFQNEGRLGSLESFKKTKPIAKKKAKQRLKSVSESDNTNTTTTKQQSASVQTPSKSKRQGRQMSVSSDVSVRPEEDIMAVVEDIDKQIEADEKKVKAQAARLQKASQSQHHDEKVIAAAAVPTQPEDVPTWTPKMKKLSWAEYTHTNNDNNNNNNNNSTDVTSPMPISPSPLSPTTPSSSKLATSPTSTATSLRDIMRQESHSNKPDRKQSFPSHFSRKESKKHRKKEIVEDSNPVAVPAPKSPVSPWGLASSAVSGVVSSFRDLMLEDKDRVPKDTSTPTTTTTTTKRNVASPDLSQSSGSSRSNRSRRSTPISIPFHSPPDQATTSPRADNPWQKRLAESVSTSSYNILCSTSPPAAPPQPSPHHPPPRKSPGAKALNFSDILQDEREKEEILVKMKQKPLALIQLEEKAMLELLHHYRASDRIDDYVTVERVSRNVAATPIWQREKPSTGAFSF